MLNNKNKKQKNKIKHFKIKKEKLLKQLIDYIIRNNRIYTNIK